MNKGATSTTTETNVDAKTNNAKSNNAKNKGTNVQAAKNRHGNGNGECIYVLV